MTRDILDEFEQQRRAPAYPSVPATPGLVVEDRGQWLLRRRRRRRRSQRSRSAIAMAAPARVRLEGRRLPARRSAGHARSPEGRVRRATAGRPPVVRSQSALRSGRRLAAASRIWVEGTSRRRAGANTCGATTCASWASSSSRCTASTTWCDGRTSSGPAPTVDSASWSITSSPGSKEDRLARQVAGPHVLVTGHPFVDVWAGVWPRVMGLTEWPDVPRDVEWKAGPLRRARHRSQGFLAAAAESGADVRRSSSGAGGCGGALDRFRRAARPLTSQTMLPSSGDDHQERKGAPDDHDDRCAGTPRSRPSRGRTRRRRPGRLHGHGAAWRPGERSRSTSRPDRRGRSSPPAVPRGCSGAG